jgi:predicted amidohydrolase
MRLESRAISELLALSKEISIGVGFVERAPDGRVFNSAAFLEDGKVLGVHRKVHLVTYGMFDEERDFAAGNEFAAFESKHGRFGFLICEDLWHVSSAYQLFLDNVDAMFVVSCGPGRGVEAGSGEFTSVRTWRTLLAAHALFCQTWMCYVNRVGWEDGVLFSGASRVVDPFGAEVAALDHQEEGSLEARLRSRENERARTQTPLRRDAKPWLLREGLERWSRRGGRL